jgi:hydrogenase maturation factor
MKTRSGTITEIFLEDGIPRATVRAGDLSLPVALTLMMDVRVGDEVLIDSGIALSRICAPHGAKVAMDKR